MQYHEAANLFPMDTDSIQDLADDIRKNGQLNPIELMGGKILDGRRRWAACQLAGVDPVTTEVNPSDPFAYSISLNLHRRHLTVGQRAMIGDRVREHYDQQAKERQAILNGKTQLQENLPEASKGQSRDQVGKLVGVSGKNIDYARKVREQGEPELIQAVEEGRVAISAAARIVEEPAEIQVFEASVQEDGSKARVWDTTLSPEWSSPEYLVTSLDDFSGMKFGTIYADPPWKYGNQATRAATDNHYPTMTVDELCEMPIANLAADDAHLHLWTTNAFLLDAYRVMESWGFEYRSVFVWVKPQMGIGNYWRVSHEFLLLGIRGRAKSFYERNHMSWAEYPRSKHSAKPDEIREKIERVSPGPFLELFGRKEVPGWAVFGNQIERATV